MEPRLQDTGVGEGEDVPDPEEDYLPRQPAIYLGSRRKTEDRLRLLSIKDRLKRSTVDNKLELMEKEMLEMPLLEYQRFYDEREKYDVTKPIPYNKEEKFESRKREDRSLGKAEDSILDASLQRIAFNRYQEHSLKKHGGGANY